MDEPFLGPKILYFTVNMFMYSVYTLQAQFLVSKWGLNMQQVGYLSGLTGLNFFGAIAWSRLADRTGQHKAILIWTSIAYAVLYCLLLLPADWFDANGGNDVFLSKNNYIAVVTAASNICMSAIFPLLDSRVLILLSGQKTGFGKQRVWGTIGHAIITLLTTEAVEMLGFNSMFILLVVCTTMFVITVIICVPSHIAYDLPIDDVESSLINSQCNPQKPEIKTSSITKLLLTSGPFLSLLILVLTAGYTRSVMAYFQPYYVAIVLQKGNRLVSCAISGRVLTEAVFYYFSGNLDNHIGSEWMLLTGQLLGLIRMAGYAFFPIIDQAVVSLFRSSVPIILALELLKGASTSLTMTSAICIASDLAPDDGQSTAQGIYSGVWQGLSMSLGGIFGAWLISCYPDDSSGLHGLFVVSFVGVFIILSIYLVRALICSRLRFPVTGGGLVKIK